MHDREYGLTPTRTGATVTDQTGNYAQWSDGLSTYTMQWRGAGHTGWQTADWADTLIAAADAIMSAPERLTDPEFVSQALADVARLARMAEAVTDELLRAARTETPEGEPLLSWAQIGDAQDLNRSTPRRRFERLTAGERALYADRLTPRHTAG